MPRIAVRPRTAAVTVRQAGPEDASALALVVQELGRAQRGTRSARMVGHPAKRSALTTASTSAQADLDERLARALGAPHHFVFLATLEDEPAGLVWCTVGSLSEFGADRVVHVEQFHVQACWRRRGVGRALLHAVSALAESHGATAVTMWTGPQDREVNRYFARVGFAPLAVRRMAPVGALRRALTPSADVSGAFPRAGALRRGRRTAI